MVVALLFRIRETLAATAVNTLGGHFLALCLYSLAIGMPFNVSSVFYRNGGDKSTGERLRQQGGVKRQNACCLALKRRLLDLVVILLYLQPITAHQNESISNPSPAMEPPYDVVHPPELLAVHRCKGCHVQGLGPQAI